jgi:cytochrome c oxidase accessory protein FixG
VIGFIALIIFIVLFTAIYGRVFCGWVCPQTVFMEMVFRRIEYWLEGDAKHQRILNAAPWTGRKPLIKLSKYIIFWAVSFLIANIFLAYIIGSDGLLAIIQAPVQEHLGGFIAINIFTMLFYFVFASFREQACTIVCPYGRLQGVLLDKNSLVVAYDFPRGEPRGRLRRNEVRKGGDCVQCELCVDVCPTGIDIRNGIQLECVNCTACIDACDAVMDKIGKPRGLIRYDSLNGIINRVKFKVTPRIISYSAILAALLSLLVYLLLTRSDFTVNVLRTPGMLYQDQPGNKVSNIYNLYIINKTFDKAELTLRVTNMDAEVKILGRELALNPQEVYEGRFMIIAERAQLTTLNTKLDIGIYKGEKEVKTIKTSFLTHLEQAQSK